MDVVEYLLLLLVFFVGILGGGSVIQYWTYRQARSKGYRPPAAGLILLLEVGAGIGTTSRLPRRTVRVFGERKARFPFRRLGRLFQILAIAVWC